MTKSYQELLVESDLFITFLQSQNITATRDDASFRDYHVKIRNVLGQTVILYHKPTKQTFSIGTHEISDPHTKNQVETLWQNYKYPEQSAIQGLCAYVDGSFYNEKIGWGMAIVLDGELLDAQGGVVPLTPEEGARQIAGEVQAVIQALDYADQKEYKEITICYDYIGLQKWAQLEWRAQSLIAQYYVAKLMQFRHISITWRKVKAHTGNKFNEMADQLAKQYLA